MGIIESKQISSAIKHDGLHNVKKSAFIQSSLKYLENGRPLIKQDWEDALRECLQKTLQFISIKKNQLQKMFEQKRNQVQIKDPELIAKLQCVNKKSFKELTGYKMAYEKFEILESRFIRNWKEQTNLVFEQIDTQIQATKQKLSRETPQLRAFAHLGRSTTQKVFNQYIQNDQFQIERQKYHQKAIQMFEKQMPFEQIYQERFDAKKTEGEVFGILKRFQEDLRKSTKHVSGCITFC